ncbi:NXPE family member 4-like [Antedon mediterranea]|uniref:NXPE family member 4-like n=1 Tax=Antedon mediterranea TaxID=105859 RepID=UPI003AF92BB0
MAWKSKIVVVLIIVWFALIVQYNTNFIIPGHISYIIPKPKHYNSNRIISESTLKNYSATEVYTNRSEFKHAVLTTNKPRSTIRNLIVSLTENVGMIDLIKTTFQLKNPNRTVKVGDYFNVTIEARDRNGRHRKKGGDFLFASIKSNKGNSAGKVTDFNNGTYEIVFFAGWPGIISIAVVLVHPSEAVDYIEQEVWPMKERIVWQGRFQTANASQITTCRFRDDVLLNSCNYSYPLAIGKTAFYCDKPDQIPCNKLINLKSDGDYVNKKFSKFYNSHQTLFNGDVAYKLLINGTTSVNISLADNQTSLFANIPECKADLPIPPSDGFWTGATWNSLKCKTKQWTKPEIIECIKGKHIILMGDSTTRQWAEGLLEIMKVSTNENTSRPSVKHYLHHSDIMNLDFYFHPYTIGKAGMPYRLGKWEYEILDNLNYTSCNYVIMASPWAHYSQWTKNNVLKRLQLLRETLLRFKKRCPNAPVLMKTPHPREHKNQATRIYMSDRLLYDIHELYFNIFSGLGIHIIDIWDMNLSYPRINNVHMPMQVIYQELFMMFSHICPVT